MFTDVRRPGLSITPVPSRFYRGACGDASMHCNALTSSRRCRKPGRTGIAALLKAPLCSPEFFQIRRVRRNHPYLEFLIEFGCSRKRCWNRHLTARQPGKTGFNAGSNSSCCSPLFVSAICWLSGTSCSVLPQEIPRSCQILGSCLAPVGKGWRTTPVQSSPTSSAKRKVSFAKALMDVYLVDADVLANPRRVSHRRTSGVGAKPKHQP